MTSKLKRKLGDLGVDTHSAKANESFCLIGTPLPPLEKSKDTGEFVPLWKQEVRDEKGRRRLHGAFTGGFSAGYFNTVGSKEGWTPSTFVSSRTDRAKKKQARPEDFMDEEDMAELAESRKLVDTTEEMDITGGTLAERARKGGVDDEEDSMAQKLEQALLPPPKDSVGARILKKMGWRMGQGIGPRLTYRQKKLQDALYVTGAAPALGEEDAEDAEAAKHTYAPRDTPLVIPQRKDNSHGLGYSAGMSLLESVGNRGAQPKGPQISAGFGLGALNDADDDDIDVYESGGSRNRTRMAYDIADRDENEDIIMGGSRKSVHRGATQKSEAPSGSFFRDGRPVLKGFVIDDKPVVEDQWFALPEVPKGWKPNPQGLWDKENAKPPPEPTTQPQSHRDWKTGISADQRGSMLGETPLPAAPRSVFDYLSQKSKERLDRAVESALTGDAPPPEVPRVPNTPAAIARAALQGFQPYAADPAKDARYQLYLRSQIEPDAPALTPMPGQSVSAFNKEASDFAASAAVFKPMSAAMAGRFTRAAAPVVLEQPKVHVGLYTPTFEEEKEEVPAEEKKEVKKVEDPQTHAAHMGMYGPMTRTTAKWAPAKLLCKRFGVKDPHPDTVGEEDLKPPPAADTAPAGSDVTAPLALTDGAESSTKDGGQQAEEPAPSGQRDLSNIGLGEDNWQARDVLTYKRPGMDVFKAIFASDDEDSDAEDKPDEDEEPEPVIETPAPATERATATSTDEPRAQKSAPAHLTAESSTAASYAPSAPPEVPEAVDLATFKPTFVPRSARETKPDVSEPKPKKRKEKALVSFANDGEEDALDIGLGAPKPKKRKDKDKDKGREKKRKKKDVEEEDDWVEKEVPAAVKEMEKMSVDVKGSVPESEAPKENGEKHKGRKRAIDFM